MAAVACEAQPLVVHSADSARLEIVAPELITRAFVVSNPASNRLNLIEAVTLPEGWRLILQDSTFSLLPSGSDLRLLGISVPAATAPGPYQVTYQVRSAEDASLIATAQTEVLVLPVFKVDVAVRDVPTRVMAGEDYTVQFQVTSRCNAACPVSARITGSGNFPVILSDTSWLAQPGQSKLVTAVVRTSGKLKSVLKHRLNLKVRVSDQDKERKEAVAHTSVDIIPLSVPAGDFYHRLPSVMAARYVSEAGRGAFQMEYSGSGSLDTRNAYKLSYLFRGPRDLEQNSLGMRSEYFVAVENRNLDARVGDILFNLSPLMEQNRLARGAKGRLAGGPFSVGGYSFAMRPKYPDLQEKAGFLGFSPSSHFEVKLNYLDKSSRSLSGRMAGISTSINPLRNAGLDVEYCADVTSRNLSRQNSAIFARFNGGLGGVRISFERAYAGRNFSGYYHDESHTAFSVFMPVSPSFQYHASYRSIAQNLSHDSLRATALSERNVQTGLSYTFPFRTGLNLDADELSRADELGLTDLDYRERSATLRVRHTFKTLTLYSSAKEGLWDNHRLHSAGNLERYGCGFTFTPDNSQSYSASFQSGTSSLGSGQRSNSLSASTNLRIARRLTLGLSFQTSTLSDPSSFQNDQFAADFRCEVYRGQAITLRARKVSYAQQTGLQSGLSYMAAYEIPIGIPVARQSDVGGVKGKVYDEENADNKGISGVVLTLDGLTAVSDSKGRYIFPSVTPGVHYLQVDHASIGLHRVTTRRIPVEIRVRGGKTEIFNIGVVRAGFLKGQTALFTRGESSRGYLVGSDSLAAMPDSAQSLRLKSGLENIEIELRRSDEVLHTATDSQGNFTLPELRPGQWQLLVLKESLPAFHQTERSVYDVFVSPGDSQDLTIRVIPRTRSLIIVDEGTVPIITSSRK